MKSRRNEYHETREERWEDKTTDWDIRRVMQEPDTRAEGAHWDKGKLKETKDKIMNFKTALKAVKGKTKQ